MLKRARLVCAASLVIVFSASGMAQQTVPFRNNTPIAPQGIQIPPLPDKPVVYHTAEGQDIRVIVYTRGLKRPWSATWLPDGTMLVTERTGQVRAIRDGVLDPNPVGAPPS